MSWEEDHELDIIEDLFEDLHLDGPTQQQMYSLFGFFKKDMIDQPIFIDGIQVAYNKKRSIHPLFKGKPEGFEHICTRESKYNGKRQFDPERANKIHWIKPIIAYKDNARIKYFERSHSNGKNQKYYWFHSKCYVVIIRVITEKLQLVTAFKIDKLNTEKYKNWYKEFQNRR